MLIDRYVARQAVGSWLLIILLVLLFVFGSHIFSTLSCTTVSVVGLLGVMIIGVDHC